MINYYTRSDNGKLKQTDALVPGAWVNVIAPTEAEIDELVTATGAERDFLIAALDEEERGRVETEDGITFILLDTPIAQKDEKNMVSYSTLPVGIVATRDNIITICLNENTILKDFASGYVKNLNPVFKTRFVLQILLHISIRYMSYLKQIDKIFDHLEKQLYKSTKNRELIQLLDLQKSLVYLSTSLKTTEVTMNKIERGKILKLYEDDQDLLDDVIIEYRQAREMAEIYNSILTGTMDAFASVISNNVNEIMKRLTYITILVAIPNMIAGFFGMNMDNIPLTQFFWFPIALSALIIGIVLFIFLKKKML
ncbi:magnesium transporter [Clostridia bacterium]|nr:magnesium transporter [Clostridia bacterium]